MSRECALVTGAGGGIGRAIAIELGSRGCDTVLVGRRTATLEETRDLVRERSGGRARIIVADLAARGAVAEMCRELEAAGVEVDILVNNAARGLYGEFSGADWDELSGMLRLNVLAVTELTRRLLPAMIARGRGRVLNVASTASFKPGPMMAVYNASKAYVLSFTEALADELRNTGVTATALCPGATRTSFAETAGMRPSQLPRYKPVPEASSVAIFAVDALFEGRRVAVHGLTNRMITFAERFVPRRWVTAAGRIVRGGGTG
jgi:short-subunit dehydrogenase